MQSHFIKNRVLAGLAIGLIVTLLCGIGITTSIFSTLNNSLSNSLYTVNSPSKNIVIIAIDDKSTQTAPDGLGLFNKWTRDNFTNLLKVLESANPKVITLDFIFQAPSDGINRLELLKLEKEIGVITESDKKLLEYDQFLQSYKSRIDHPVDDRLAEELQNFNNIILDAMVNPEGGGLIKALPKFSVKATEAIASAKLENDGTMRSAMPIFYSQSEKKSYDDIALATAKKYLGKDKINLPLQNGKMIINYFGEAYSFQMISFIDVINKKFTPDFFKDKIVLVGGTSSKEFHDEYLTPRSNVTPMPGIEIIANEIQTIIEGKFLTSQSTISSILTIAAISIGLAIALNYLTIWLAILAAFASTLLYIFAAHIFYKNGLVVNMLYPFVAIVLTYLASWIYKFFIADKNKRELKSAFGHYVSGELVEQISQNPGLVKLGGEKKTVTVFFSDIKDSTAISEKTPIEMWVSQVNEYFTEMENVVKKSGGTLDKYEGDTVMGFWNAPVPQADHVFRAYACAIGMRKALVNLHVKWAQEGKPLIEFRIGINTGEALVGNFGSKDRFDFTVMGDTVNTASRLESSANKTYGTGTIVAGFENINATSPQLQNFTIRELDTVYLPGKKEPVKLYELLGLASETTPEMTANLKTYTQGLAAYRCKDFATAIKNFQLISSDKPAQILLTRCQKIQAGEKISELDEQMIFKIQNK